MVPLWSHDILDIYIHPNSTSTLFSPSTVWMIPDNSSSLRTISGLLLPLFAGVSLKNWPKGRRQYQNAIEVTFIAFWYLWRPFAQFSTFCPVTARGAPHNTGQGSGQWFKRLSPAVPPCGRGSQYALFGPATQHQPAGPDHDISYLINIYMSMLMA
jgi:hypothetical protein